MLAKRGSAFHAPILFTLSTAPLEDISNDHDLDFMLYADDTQFYVICDKPSESIFKIKTCLNDIRLWVRSDLLILNDDKTEDIHFVSRYKKNYEQLTSLRVGGSDIISSNCIRNLGSFFCLQVMFQHKSITSVKLVFCTVPYW